MKKSLHHSAKSLQNTGGGISRSFNKETLGSDCAVRVCTSEGAPIEHPMSTHSAPIGTSWKPAGIKAVIRCMAAMFVMLFTLGVGNMWGAYYGTGRVVAMQFGGNDADFGEVGCLPATGTNGKNYDGGTYGVEFTHPSTSVSYSSTSTTKVYILCFAREIEGSGYSFAGWYTDPSCAEGYEAPSANISGWEPTSTQYAYYWGQRKEIPHTGSNTSKQNAEVLATLYAKFVKGSTTNKFQTQLTVSTESTSKGVVDVSKTGVKPLGSSVYAYDINGEHETTRGKDTRTVTGDVVETESTETFQTYYVYAQALRGYQFKKWTPGTSVTLASEDYCGTGSNCYLSAYKVSIDNQATKTNGVYGLTGTLTAEFESITANKNFSIKKEKDKGAVIGFYSNWYYDGSSKVGRKGKVDDLAGLGSSDETRSYSNFYSTDEVTLTATPAEDFLFSGWVLERESKPDSFLTTSATLTTSLFENGMVFRPIFVPDPNSLNIDENDYFLVGNSTCQTFEQAISAATQGQHKTILQLKNYTVPAGNYTIPEGVTLLIPYAEDQVAPALVLPRVENQNATDGVEYRRLTLSSGVHIDVYGTIEVSGQQATGVNAAGGEVGIGCPTGGYGCMYMGAGSSITLNNGAMLRGWGFVLGDIVGGEYKCEIDARRGSIVREQFQMMDWKGGTYTMGMTDGLNSGTAEDAHRVLPINQYYIQNVEVPVKYRPGAKLQANASVFLNGTFSGMTFKNITFNIDNVGIIGAKYTHSQDAAIFLMNDEDDSEDTWVRKYYDPATDQQVYEINNSAYLGSLELTVLGGVKVSSTEYKLPITNNFKIHLLNGQMEITQHTEFLAGSELIANKKSTIIIPSGVNVFLYDKEEWGNYISATRNANSTFTMGVGTTVRWRPGGRPTVRRDAQGVVKIEDTKFTVAGTLDVRGKLFTTTHGATIISSVEDAGTVMFSADAPADFTVSQINSLPADASHSGAFTRIACTSAQLMNKDGSLTKTYTNTDHHAVSGQSYCFMDMDGDGDGEWISLTVDEDDDCFVYDQNNVHYIKPADYVAVSATKDANDIFSGEEDNTYKSLDGTRTFIRVAGDYCQWWEVVKVDENLYHCTHPQNNTYYYWNGDTWKEKKFKVSWVNWDGSPVNYTNSENEVVNYYMVSYGTTPQWLSANPTRANDASHEYSFMGWTPDLAPVTADVTYMATYEERDRMYAITFNNASDELIEVSYCKLGEMPVCSHHTLAANEEWKTVEGELPLGAVSKDEVYKLFTKDTEGPFMIRFVNWDGEELQSGSVTKNSNPVYSGATPSKSADNSHAYTFVGWTPSIAPATQNMTYTAKFEVQQLTGLNVVDAQIIATDLVIPDVRISTTGSLNVTGSITANNFYLESNGSSASGQIVGGEDNITADHIYFDYKVNAKNHKWYGVAVPWQVDATNGISVNGRTLTLGTDFDIIYYDGARRASEGKQKCWKYVENDGDKTLQPGRLYMIGLMSDAATIRFAKKSGASLLTTSTSVTAYSGAAAADDQGWNGVANPALFHAYVNPGVTAGQVYNPETNSYDPILMNDAKFVVGQGAFVEVSSNKDITVTSGGAYAAPRRARAEEAPLMDVRIAPAEAEYTDRLFVTVDEEKETDTYVIGKDLAKLGVSKTVAQMWINRYNTELCLNTMAPVNGVAEYPLGIFAPKAGEYMITINNSQFTMHNADYALYLTLNGRVIWNLSYAPYTATLEKGTTTTYGLRLILQAPQTATGIGEAVIDAQGEARKVLIDQKVFIIRGDEVYTLDGRLVK